MSRHQNGSFSIHFLKNYHFAILQNAGLLSKNNISPQPFLVDRQKRWALPTLRFSLIFSSSRQNHFLTNVLALFQTVWLSPNRPEHRHDPGRAPKKHAEIVGFGVTGTPAVSFRMKCVSTMGLLTMKTVICYKMGVVFFELLCIIILDK